MKKSTQKKQPSRESAAQMVMEVKSDTPSYYANYVNVSHTAYDFTLSVAKISSPLTQEQIEELQSLNKITVEPILQIVIPPLLIDGLINALIDQKAKHQLTASTQVKNNDIQHQHIKQPDPIN
jgi:hypothetical protein